MIQRFNMTKSDRPSPFCVAVVLLLCSCRDFQEVENGRKSNRMMVRQTGVEPATSCSGGKVQSIEFNLLN